MSGFVYLHRKLWCHPVFKDKTEAAAFAWMISMASWRSARVRYKHITIELDRGQLAISSRDLAQDWGWSEAKARRYIDRLQTDAMIDAASDAGVTVITIRNYDAFQVPPKDGDAPSDAGGDAGPTQDRRTTDAQNNKGNQEKEERGGGSAPAHEEPPAVEPMNAQPVTKPAKQPEGSADASIEIIAKEMAIEFKAMRARFWPSDPNFPAVADVLRVQALNYLRAGGSRDLIAEVVERGMRKAAEMGKTASGSFSAFHNSITDAIATHRAALNQRGTHDGTIPPRNNPISRQRPSDHERRAAIADVFADVLADDGRPADGDDRSDPVFDPLG